MTTKLAKEVLTHKCPKCDIEVGLELDMKKSGIGNYCGSYRCSKCNKTVKFNHEGTIKLLMIKGGHKTITELYQIYLNRNYYQTIY